MPHKDVCIVWHWDMQVRAGGVDLGGAEGGGGRGWQDTSRDTPTTRSPSTARHDS